MRTSIWFQTIGQEQRRLLDLSDELPESAEIVIAGAGMIGLATAWYLSAAGVRDICVLDRESALAEASGANAGGLWFSQQSPELGELAPLAVASSRLYDELSAGGLKFDFRHSGVLELLDSAGPDTISPAEARRLEPALETGLAARYYPDDAQLNPVKLGAALIGELRNRNVRFCYGAEVRRAGRRLETTRGTIAAGIVVIACGAWTPLVTRTLGWAPPIRPMRGQLLATRPLAPLLHHTVIGPRFYYWQLAEGHVAGGGTVEDAGFERGVTGAGIAAIRSEMDMLFPALRGEATECAWSGFRPYCDDLRPVVGKVPGQEGLWVAAGHFKKGVLLAPVTGRIVADLITSGHTDLPEAALDPARFA